MNGAKVELTNEGLAGAIKKGQFSNDELDCLKETGALTEEELIGAKAVPKAYTGPDRWTAIKDRWKETVASEDKANITFDGEIVELTAAEFDVMISAIPDYTEEAWEMEDDFPGIEAAAETLRKKTKVFEH